jgi:hypothetical protein
VGKKNITRNKKYNIIVEAFREIYNNEEYEAYKSKKATAKLNPTDEEEDA